MVRAARLKCCDLRVFSAIRTGELFQPSSVAFRLSLISRDAFALRQYLKGRTAPLHSELDAIVGKLDTLRSYKHYLDALLSFREPLERAVRQARPLARLGLRPKFIASAIRRDMDDLGLPPAPDMGATTIIDTSQLVGTLYVLEGSALGARMVYRRALDLGLSAQFGARHLACQMQDKASWPEFLAVLDRHDQSNAEDTARASVAAFEHALIAFRGSLSEH